MTIDLRPPDASKLDAPFDGRDYRLYVAVTNRCNLACPFCSTYSAPTGTTFITLGQVLAHVPREGKYQVQFEGGEPLLHPDIGEFTMHFSHEERCTRIIISTNGSLFPFKLAGKKIDENASRVALRSFFSRFPARMTLKVSLNHHLLGHDPLLFEKAAFLLKCTAGTGIDLIFNLRKRNDPAAGHDEALERAIDEHGLRGATNSFFLQRYGRNSNDENAEHPFIVGTNWCTVNPDGSAWGIDLIGRSEAMRRLG
ncbi:MAG: radical SAM protein [Candidatus Lokiarchaeota archaeon]|nr:radical SAM protein [Candidatus Lokiarchaeota archaeon]